MPSENNKKLIPFYILKILKEESDVDHPLMQETIAQKIVDVYGANSCDRKTVGANIETLIDFGYDIVKVKNKGVYLCERELDKSQISFLIDAVFSSKIITSKQAQELAQKLSSFLSEHQRKQFKYIFKTSEVARANNAQIFYTIETIHEAIDKGKKISFDYKRTNFNVNGKSDVSTKYVNPYFLVNNQGKYYLVCGYNAERGLANYKVEKISNIKILEKEDLLPITKVKGYEKGFDIAKYANENIYMFGGKTIKAKLLINEDYAIAYVEDWFDNTTRIYRKEDKTYAEITANEQALIYWGLQYGESVELVEPLETREKIKQAINKIQKKYN